MLSSTGGACGACRGLPGAIAEACHSERSEESREPNARPASEIPRSARNDKSPRRMQLPCGRSYQYHLTNRNTRTRRRWMGGIWRSRARRSACSRCSAISRSGPAPQRPSHTGQLFTLAGRRARHFGHRRDNITRAILPRHGNEDMQKPGTSIPGFWWALKSLRPPTTR
jgi:hypothetical protein